VGSIFTIYTQLEPSIYSLGGIGLALCMLLIARVYHKIMNIEYFYRISMFVEVVVLLMILYFMINPYQYISALIVYIGYQVTFVFGSYLVRAETKIARKDKLLTYIDTAKQLGYLSGMGASYIFYKLLEIGFDITSKERQVYDLHFLLILCEIGIIWFLVRSFPHTDYKK
jgi:ABC-type Fe3+-siderophore transport system permease subunit